jgi:hypothetical protein
MGLAVRTPPCDRVGLLVAAEQSFAVTSTAFTSDERACPFVAMPDGMVAGVRAAVGIVDRT